MCSEVYSALYVEKNIEHTYYRAQTLFHSTRGLEWGKKLQGNVAFSLYTGAISFQNEKRLYTE